MFRAQNRSVYDMPSVCKLAQRHGTRWDLHQLPRPLSHPLPFPPPLLVSFMQLFINLQACEGTMTFISWALSPPLHSRDWRLVQSLTLARDKWNTVPVLSLSFSPVTHPSFSSVCLSPRLLRVSFRLPLSLSFPGHPSVFLFCLSPPLLSVSFSLPLSLLSLALSLSLVTHPSFSSVSLRFCYVSVFLPHSVSLSLFLSHSLFPWSPIRLSLLSLSASVICQFSSPTLSPFLVSFLCVPVCVLVCLIVSLSIPVSLYSCIWMCFSLSSCWRTWKHSCVRVSWFVSCCLTLCLDICHNLWCVFIFSLFMFFLLLYFFNRKHTHQSFLIYVCFTHYCEISLSHTLWQLLSVFSLSLYYVM